MGNFGKRQFGKKRQNLAHQKLSLQIKLKFVLSPELYVNNTSTTALLGKFIDCDKHHTCPNTFTLALFNKRKLFFPPNYDAGDIYRESDRTHNRQ